MKVQLLRSALFGAALVSLLVLACARALAVTEYCPAIVGDFHPWRAGGEGAFSYDLIGFAPRELAGTIVVQSDSGWFSFAFDNARMVKRSERAWAPEQDSISFDDFSSDALYVVFPKPVKIVRAWLNDATLRSGASTPWAVGQHLSCDPLATDGDDFIKWRRGEVRMQPERIIAATRDGVTVSSAVAMLEPAGLHCKKPFVDATARGATLRTTVTELAEGDQSHVVLVAVAISSRGVLDDAWIYASSGVPDLDAAALKAARSTSYVAGVALCAPAPTEALFRAEF